MTRQEQQEKFFRAIGYVGDDLIQRADAPVERHGSNGRRWLHAACWSLGLPQSFLFSR